MITTWVQSRIRQHTACSWASIQFKNTLQPCAAPTHSSALQRSIMHSMSVRGDVSTHEWILISLSWPFPARVGGAHVTLWISHLLFLCKNILSALLLGFVSTTYANQVSSGLRGVIKKVPVANEWSPAQKCAWTKGRAMILRSSILSYMV